MKAPLLILFIFLLTALEALTDGLIYFIVYGISFNIFYKILIFFK